MGNEPSHEARPAAPTEPEPRLKLRHLSDFAKLVAQLEECASRPESANSNHLQRALYDIGDACTSDTERHQAVRAIGAILNSDALARDHVDAVIALGSCGPVGGAAVLPLMKDSRPEIRATALESLRASGLASAGAVDALSMALSENHVNCTAVPYIALCALTELGDVARSAAPAVLRVLRERSDLREEAVLAGIELLGIIGQDVAGVPDFLNSKAEDGTSAEQHRCALSLLNLDVISQRQSDEICERAFSAAATRQATALEAFLHELTYAPTE